MEAPSATDIPEAALIRWLLLESPAQPNLLSPLGVTEPAKVWFEQRPQRLIHKARAPGDIDVLIASKNSPHLATGIEVKRIKVQPAAFATESPNKLADLRLGVRQANALHCLGFCRSVLMIVIVTDGRERQQFNAAFRGPTEILRQKVYQSAELTDLHPDVGLIVVEPTQILDKPLQDAGALPTIVVRAPTPRAQSEMLTASIKQLFIEAGT